MKIFKALLTIMLVFTLPACSSDPKPQSDFMSIVDSHRDKFVEMDRGGNFIDKDAQLDQIMINRNERINQFIQKNAVQNWNGTVDRITMNNTDQAVSLKVKIGYETFFLSGEVPLTDPIVSQIKSLKEGDDIKFSGKFRDSGEPERKETLFSEYSFTRAGSMEEPEIFFTFTSITK